MPLAVTLPYHPATLRSGVSYPRALNVLSRRQTAVQRQLRRAGLAGYEPLTQATLMALAERAPSGGAVYDVGSHIGLYAALIDAVFGRQDSRKDDRQDRRQDGSRDGCREGSGERHARHARRGLAVHAFEPTPGTVEICRSLREHNQLGFEVVPSAVSDTPGSAELYLSLKAESSNSLNSRHRRHDESVTVPVTTLDVFTRERAAQPHLIKIDVETLEGQVLLGGLETIRRYRPWIVVEILPGSDHGTLGRALRSLTELGYGLHLIQSDAPWHARDHTTYRPLVSSVCRDWLLAPEPLTAGFHRAVRGWLMAILACDERTNLLSPPGQRLPRGWNAAYRPPSPRSWNVATTRDWARRVARDALAPLR